MFKSIRLKIFSGYFVLLLLIVMVGFWAIFNFVNLSDTLNQILSENYISVLAAENMIGSIERQDSSVLYYLLGQKDFSSRLFDEYHNEFMMWFGREKDNITIPGEEELVNRVEEEYKVFLAYFDEIKIINDEKGHDAAVDYYFSTLQPKFMQIRQICKQLLEMNHQTIVERNEIAKNVASKAVWSTVLVSFLAVLIGIIWNLITSQIIIGPILMLTEKVKGIAAGNLDEEININTNDEIGILATEFNRMTMHLKEYQNTNIDKIIAERKKSETIVREINDGIIVVDAQNKISLVNRAAEIILYKSESEIIGKHILEVIKNENIFKMTKEALEDKVIHVEDSDIVTVSEIIEGAKKYYTVEVTKIEGKEGRIEGAVILLGDVNRFKELDEMKSEFVSIVSHEFRTPLTSIQMGVGLLQESELLKKDSKEKELLNIVDEDSKRLNRLVNELLDLTKIESGKINLIFSKIDIVSLVQDSVRPFELQAEGKNIKISVNNKGDQHIYVYANYDKIMLVLVNLISNAMRYTPEGGSINLGVEKLVSKAYISIKDNGIGIPKKYQETIFEKFTQVKNDGVNAGGAGLGLALSKDIIKLHKGRIWVESEEGKGSKFIFALPVLE